MGQVTSDEYKKLLVELELATSDLLIILRDPHPDSFVWTFEVNRRASIVNDLTQRLLTE